MRRVLAILLAVLMVFSMAACRGSAPGVADKPDKLPDIIKPDNPEKPIRQEDPKEPDAPEKSEEAYDDPADHPVEEDYTVFSGTYRDLVSEQEGETGYVVITAHNDFLLLEHFLCMDGSVYSFWAEEFWPGEGYYPGGKYPSVYGKSQMFSSMTSLERYEDAPKNRSITLTEDGIVLNYDDADAEYYILDNTFSGHSSAEEMLQRLGESVTLKFEDLYGSEEILGTWAYRDGSGSICITFAEDGTFSLFRKTPGKPIESYCGVFAFGEYSGNLEISTERIGSGEYPYTVNWEWMMQDNGNLSLWDEAGILLTSGTEHGFWPVQHAFFTDLEQQDALSYLYNVCDMSGNYTDCYETEYFYRYALPQFYGCSDAVTEVNQSITDTFSPLIEMEQTAMETGEFLSYDTVDWEAEIFEGVLYLHVYAMSFDWEEHAAFYLDTATGELLDTEQVLERLLIDPGYFLQAVTDGAEEAYLEFHEGIPKEEREEYGYYDMLEWTVSEEAVNLELPIFADRWGSIAVYAKIGTLAGAGMTWEVLYPFDGAVG